MSEIERPDSESSEPQRFTPEQVRDAMDRQVMLGNMVYSKVIEDERWAKLTLKGKIVSFLVMQGIDDPEGFYSDLADMLAGEGVLLEPTTLTGADLVEDDETVLKTLGALNIEASGSVDGATHTTEQIAARAGLSEHRLAHALRRLRVAGMIAPSTDEPTEEAA